MTGLVNTQVHQLDAVTSRPIADQVAAALAIAQAHEAILLSLGVSKRDMANALNASMKALKLTDDQRRIVRDLLQSV